jgi:hypothetical protein
MHARKSAPGVGGFSRPASDGSATDLRTKDLRMTNLVWNVTFIFFLCIYQCFDMTGPPRAGDARNAFHCGAAKVVFELIRAAQPSSPVLEELRRRGNAMCYHLRQLCGIQDTDSECDSIHIEVECVGLAVVLYAVSDSLFLQDAHRRVALVIARMLRAEERERGTPVEDSGKGKKIFSLPTSAECVRRLSMLPNCIWSHRLQTATSLTWKKVRRARGTGSLHRASKSDTILLVMRNRLRPQRFFFGQSASRLSTTACSNAGLRTAPRFSALQSALPWVIRNRGLSVRLSFPC